MKMLKLSLTLLSLMAVAGCAYNGVIYDSYTTDDLNLRWSSYGYSGYSSSYYGVIATIQIITTINPVIDTLASIILEEVGK